MRIAFISLECPPDTAWGGIGTYVHQASRVLAARGHDVEVFTASPERAVRERVDGVLVHRIREVDLGRFPEEAGRAFAERHARAPFDVLEGPDFNAEARVAVHLAPDVPLVVKLHTPSMLLFRVNHGAPSRLRLALDPRRAWLAPVTTRDTGGLTVEADRAWAEGNDAFERPHALDADEIAAPSLSVGRVARELWGVRAELVRHVPYPFVPPAELLSLADDGGDGRTVTFVGRLEARKGVLDLARAIPHVLARRPAARFLLVGPSDASPRPRVTMRDHLAEELSPYAHAVELVGEVPPSELPEILAASSVCVFPSRWENLPFVCLEAMAASRAIVGSSAGGMSELLAPRRSGELVPPGRPRRLAAAIAGLLASPRRRVELGRAARARVLREYGASRIGALMEESYGRAIERRRRLGPRRPQG